MTPQDLDQLERIARQAAENLPGAWRVDDRDEAGLGSVAFLDTHAGESRWLIFARCSGGCLEWPSGSEHIAAFDPPTVLALIAAARKAIPTPESISHQEAISQ